jgi:hypothetical protein
LSTQTDLPVLEQLVIKQQIQELLFNYAFFLDMNQPDDLAALFTEDCEVIYAPNFGAHGRAEYRKTLEGIGTFFAATSHHVSNLCVYVDTADEARARSVLYAWHRYNRDRPDGHMWGQYHDELVKVDGTWQFKRRELRVAGVKDFHVKDNIMIGRREGTQ